MGQELRRTQDPEARQQLVFAMQRYATELQHYVYLYAQMCTGSWQPYVKIYALYSGAHVARRRSKNAATSGGTDVKWTAKPWEPSGMGPMTLA